MVSWGKGSSSPLWGNKTRLQPSVISIHSESGRVRAISWRELGIARAPQSLSESLCHLSVKCLVIVEVSGQVLNRYLCLNKAYIVD